MDANGWIAVEDKLPPELDEVLVQLNTSVNSSMREIGHWYHNLWWVEMADGYRAVTDFGGFVSHWQPLPELVRLVAKEIG